MCLCYYYNARLVILDRYSLLPDLTPGARLRAHPFPEREGEKAIETGVFSGGRGDERGLKVVPLHQVV